MTLRLIISNSYYFQTCTLVLGVLVFTQLVVDYVFDERLRSLLDNYDFYVMPCVNPDGYEHSHSTVRRTLREGC